VSEPPVATPTPLPNEGDLGSRSLDDLNRESPFKPVFFDLDSTELSADGQSSLNANAELMKRYPTWVVTVEGHCDERGTAEYNLALGERRALSARNYLVSLGIPADRLRTVSYGKEFPFDPGRTEEAYAKNRRAHFVVTAK
jgi:peptidoglycan-associated lipoprotein